MRVIVFEDDDDKWNVIVLALKARSIREANIIRYVDVAQFAHLKDTVVDLCIIDLRMPHLHGGTSENVGLEILSLLQYSGRSRIPTMAITAYAEEAAALRAKFAERGCLIFDYGSRESWGNALDVFVSQAQERGRYDFVVFTALAIERNPYLKLFADTVTSTTRNGLDVWEVELRGKSGAVVLLPSMGLVNASVVVARVLEHYSPSVVAMSGICAGIGDSVALGQLLVADVCWEYQSGKWLDDAFKAEPYQVHIPPNTRLRLQKLLEQEKLAQTLEVGYDGSTRPPALQAPKLAAFATGSAVIASEKRIKMVQEQHRKVAGLDMEIFGFYRAAELSEQNLKVFAVKTVVDKGTRKKSDELQEYGCFVSAAFTFRAIDEILE